ncbi:MAG: ECF transporter S component [Dehalococcoidia bacterium]|nr:ECF transporter S component [Dehalococcoidia bacterium]
MINRIAFSRPQTFLMTLKYADIRSYILTAVFLILAVLTPYAFHQFHLAGPTFLPMHIFVLIAGLLFGWRAGLIVGLLTPLVSHFISGMPVLNILPQIVIELSAYGLIAGMLRQKYNLRPIWALLGAMLGGRVVLLLAMLTIYIIAGQSYSPLGPEASPFASFWSVIKQGWPGIAIQLISIPVIVWLVGKFATRDTEGRLTKRG